MQTYLTLPRLVAAALLLIANVIYMPTALALARPTDDAALTIIGRTVSIDVLANDAGSSGAARVILQLRTPPAHGTAQVVGGRIEYVPAPGFTGQDRLTYLMKGIRSYGVASVVIDVRDAGQALTLRGKVAGPVANAPVVASVGIHQFRTVADAVGDYSLEVIGFGADMLSLAASGDGAQPSVALRSVVGAFARLEAEAGADRWLTRAENNRVQVTQVSTAEARLLRLANGDAPIANAVEFDYAHGALDAGPLSQIAAAIKLVVDGAFALPAGVSDTWALTGNVPAFNAFVASVNAADPRALENAAAAIFSDVDVMEPLNAGLTTGTRTQLLLGKDGDVPIAFIQGQRLTLSTGGTGTFLESTKIQDAGLTWMDDGTVVDALLDSPRITEFLSFINGTQVRTRNTTTRIETSFIRGGGAGGRDLVALTYHTTRTYPDNPEIPSYVYRSTASSHSFRDGMVEIPFAASEFPSVRSLEVHRANLTSPIANESGYALHRFNADGSGFLLDDGQTFTWNLVGGRLVVSYDDGETTTRIRLSRDSRKGEGIITVFALPDGSAKSRFMLSSVRDGSLVFDLANAAVSWRSGFYVSFPDDFYGYRDEFFLVLDGAGQTGSRISIFSTGSDITPVSWRLVGEQLVIRRFRNNTGWVAECTVGVSGCIQFDERRWIPVSRSGNRIYISEELLQRNNATGMLELINQRGNFYQVEPPPIFSATTSLSQARPRGKR